MSDQIIFTDIFSCEAVEVRFPEKGEWPEYEENKHEYGQGTDFADELRIGHLDVCAKLDERFCFDGNPIVLAKGATLGNDSETKGVLARFYI